MALQKRINRQQRRARRRAGRQGALPEQQPSDPYPPRILKAFQGGSTDEIKTVKNGLATYKYVYKNPRPSEKVDVEMFQDQVKRKYSRGGKV
tara:strand:- start:1279 stop:1554 length:276 start_codon:yes stop_codon:yes gene_type:complete